MGTNRDVDSSRVHNEDRILASLRPRVEIPAAFQLGGEHVLSDAEEVLRYLLQGRFRAPREGSLHQSLQRGQESGAKGESAGVQGPGRVGAAVQVPRAADPDGKQVPQYQRQQRLPM